MALDASVWMTKLVAHGANVFNFIWCTRVVGKNVWMHINFKQVLTYLSLKIYHFVCVYGTYIGIKLLYPYSVLCSVRRTHSQKVLKCSNIFNRIHRYTYRNVIHVMTCVKAIQQSSLSSYMMNFQSFTTTCALARAQRLKKRVNKIMWEKLSKRFDITIIWKNGEIFLIIVYTTRSFIIFWILLVEAQ